MSGNRTTELLDGLRHVGNLHEFAELFGFDWHDDSDWTWHDVAAKMADDFEQAIAAMLVRKAGRMSEYIVELTEENHARLMAECDGIHEEIVRCRDCKYCHKNYCEKRISPVDSPSAIFWIPIKPDGFCAWGERRSE